ncbi:hypothetical protein DL771_009467 [Monosporascus sp. 5C6A]|nr:hypothetical protein DL771_009467 [Monosporascus sp. 5C6A]
MGGVKRDHEGKEKEKKDKARDVPRNAYTSMFEAFRDELDEHHDRRMKVQKVSRDVTALSKKIVRKLRQPIPQRIQSEIDERMKEIVGLLSTIEDDVQGMNRHRYSLICLEEFAEAVSFAHYLRHQTLITPRELSAALPLRIDLTPSEYVFGVFDLTGEMMRFATSVTALSGSMPAGSGDGDGDGDGGEAGRRTILADLQDVSSMLQICPPLGGGGKNSNYGKKTDVMVEQVRKVERLAYGVTVRGTERPKGWMPDLNEGPRGGGGDAEDVTMD